MHSTSSPPPNYMNQPPNGSSSYHNGSYPLEAAAHSSTIKSNYSSDQDISQIVDQVLSCIDTSHFDLDYHHPQEHNNQTHQVPDHATLLLCHNCGARWKHKVQHCKHCGEEMSGDQTCDLKRYHLI